MYWLKYKVELDFTQLCSLIILSSFNHGVREHFVTILRPVYIDCLVEEAVKMFSLNMSNENHFKVITCDW